MFGISTDASLITVLSRNVSPLKGKNWFEGKQILFSKI